MKKTDKKRRRAFTIVELVIVIAVIAILAAVLIPTFSGVVDKANDSKLLQALKNEYTEYVIADGSSDGEFNNSVVILYDGSYYTFTNGSSSTPEATMTDGAEYWDAENNEIKTHTVTTPTNPDDSSEEGTQG